jgi:hypothetical protein
MPDPVQTTKPSEDAGARAVAVEAIELFADVLSQSEQEPAAGDASLASIAPIRELAASICRSRDSCSARSTERSSANLAVVAFTELRLSSAARTASRSGKCRSL